MPRLRTIWRGTALTVGITLAVVLAAILLAKLVGCYRLGKARAAFAHAYGSADPSAWATHDDSDEDNAARLLRAGALALQIGPADIKTLTHAGHPEEWTEAQRRDLAALIERNRKALALFHRAAGVSRSVYGDPCANDDSIFPPWQIRQASIQLMVEAQLSYERGDRVAAVDSLRAITRIASSLEGEGPIINYEIGAAVEFDVIPPVVHWVQEGAKGEGEAAFLANVDIAIPSLDLIAQFRRARGNEALCFGVASVTAGCEKGAHCLLLWPIAELMQAELLQGATRGAQLINTDVPLVERMAALEQDPPTSASWPLARAGALSMVLQVAEANSSMNRTVVTAIQTLARRQLLHAALQVRILGLKNGAYPATSRDLDPLGKPEPVSGQPLVYSVQADGTAVVTYVDATLQLKDGSWLEPKRITLPRVN